MSSTTALTLPELCTLAYKQTQLKEALPKDQPALVDYFCANAPLHHYVQETRVGRQLSVPSFSLKFVQRVLHNHLSQYLPPALGTHKILEDLETSLPQYSHYIRSDVRKCFDNVTSASAQKAFNALPPLSNAKEQTAMQQAFASLLLVPKGLATGSPASPTVLELIFKDFPQTASNAKIIRYVDDILILGKSAADAQSAFDMVQTYLKQQEMELNTSKTVRGSTQEVIPFLGHHVSADPSHVKPSRVNLDIASFFGSNHWQPELSLDVSSYAPSYANDHGKVTLGLYHLDAGIAKGSLDALLVLQCADQHPLTAPLSKHRDEFLTDEMMGPMHSKLYKSYIQSVKTPREASIPVDVAAAERILSCLGLFTFLAAKGTFPKNSAAIGTEFGFDFKAAMTEAPTGAGAYHKAVKTLFKRQYDMHKQSTHVLPPVSPIQQIMLDVEDPAIYLLGDSNPSQELPEI